MRVYRRRILRRANSKCKGPEAEVCLRVSFRDSEEVGAEQARMRVITHQAFSMKWEPWRLGVEEGQDLNSISKESLWLLPWRVEHRGAKVEAGRPVSRLQQQFS